ncbi:MAG: sugar transferase [Aquaticitalea sp.]
MYSRFFKHFLDFTVALTGFIVLLPLLFILCTILFVSYKGNPFFLQERPGKNGKIFKIIKLKTMNDKKDAQGDLLPPNERLTKTGIFIRKYSLDEIPQLLNIIKGDMGLIGPRPLLSHYLPLYNEHQKKRHNIRPGITGWSQVNGRNSISWEQKFNLDVWYVENISFKLDCKIFMMTAIKVFKKEGINDAKNEINELFQGN